MFHSLSSRARIAVHFTVAAALFSVLAVYWYTNRHPRTDDASVQANYVLFAPEVSGRVTEIRVQDNEYVHAGDVLFVIDPRPYQYALQQALAEQQLLEQRIIDAQRTISAQQHAAQEAHVGIGSSHLRASMSTDALAAAAAAVQRAQASVKSMQEQEMLAQSNLRRLEPLLKKQYVTPQQVDDARTKARVAEQNYQEAEAALQQTFAQQRQSQSMRQEASLEIAASQAHAAQATDSVGRLGSLLAERGEKSVQVANAKLQLERCTVHAPFDGYVTNLNTSIGQMAKPGEPIFTLIDARNWYVMANFRESELRALRRGQHVDLFLMSAPSRRFDGTIESIGNGVAPEGVVQNNGLPQVDRTINWVHLSARFPVRIRVGNPDLSLFRLGETAIVVSR